MTVRRTNQRPNVSCMYLRVYIEVRRSSYENWINLGQAARKTERKRRRERDLLGRQTTSCTSFSRHRYLPRRTNRASDCPHKGIATNGEREGRKNGARFLSFNAKQMIHRRSHSPRQMRRGEHFFNNNLSRPFADTSAERVEDRRTGRQRSIRTGRRRRRENEIQGETRGVYFLIRMTLKGTCVPIGTGISQIREPAIVPVSSGFH